MPIETHVILDIGPGLLTILTAALIAAPGMLAAYYAFMNGRKIDTANGKLATALAMNANPAGESKLTITPMPEAAVKE
jgi:hypothetical protein